MKTKINGFEIEGSIDEIRQLINITPNLTPSISTQKISLQTKLKHQNRRDSWTKEEDQILIEDFNITKSQTKTTNRLCKVLNRSKSAIMNRINRLFNNRFTPFKQENTQPNINKDHNEKIKRITQRAKDLFFNRKVNDMPAAFRLSWAIEKGQSINPLNLDEKF